MADNISTQNTYLKIDKLIKSLRFNEAFLLLKSKVSLFPSLSRILNKLNASESTYRYLLDYISEGHSDPAHKEVISQIQDSLMFGNDAYLRESKLLDSPDLYSATKRMINLKNLSLEDYLNSFIKTIKKEEDMPADENENVFDTEQANALNELFNYVWTMFGSEISEYAILNGILIDPSVPEYVKSVIVSAIILGNLEYFDPESFDILINYSSAVESLSIKGKIIAGLVLISLINPQRIIGNVNIRSRLIIANEDEELKEAVNEVLFNIIRTYDTTRIDNKMRNEVIPGLMKIKPEIIDKLRNIGHDSEDYLSSGNPDWEEMLENSEIGDKLKEINNLQLEGADVMATAFSNLKAYPFFNSISNWFLPVKSDHYQIKDICDKVNEESLKNMENVMCDSDIYSFLLSLASLPKDKQEQMAINMNNQVKMIHEATSGSLDFKPQQILARRIRFSLQDIYRFFKYFRKRNDFKDPFEKPFIADNFEIIRNVLGVQPETLNLIAEFYFKYGYYREAAGFFELINENFKEVTLWEKLGYCYERIKDYEKAVDWYKKALLINPSNIWLQKKLAVSLKNLRIYDEALGFYQSALEQDPENYHLLMSAAQCFLAISNYEDALKYFYHANYIKPEKKDPKRAIAWAELMAGNFDKSTERYQQLLDIQDSDASDFLNAAHSFLAKGDFKKALSLYKEFINRSESKEITSLLLAFKDDADVLKKIGISTSTLRLIVDKIRYDLEN
ncbi:MAG: tetratricopeptide repeat protein [Muribaculaceae bacterium]|nr:tetratricopeptide repeat protein [Muribaculaceae bacterium]